jgi:hypothetical protein
MPPTLCWGVEIAGHLVAKWQLLDLSARVGAARLRVAGAHAVAVHHDYDGQNLVVELSQRARAEVEALDFDLMFGFAQRGALYATLGAVPFCADYEWSCDALRLPLGEADAFREFEGRDVPELVRLFNAAQAERPASLLRSVADWPGLLRKPPRIRVGEGGYLGLRDNEDALELREAGFESPRFALRALRELSRLARARGVRRVHGHLPPDHPIVQASIPYGAQVSIRYEKRAGAMAGVLRVASFLRHMQPEFEARWARSACADRELRLTLTIDGAPHEIELSPGGARPKALALSLTPAALLQLVVGYRTPSAVLAAGEGGDPALLDDRDARACLDALFPPAHPFVSHTDRW